MLQHADAIICKDWCITTQQLALSVLISKATVSHIIQDLGYSKVCTRQVPWSLTLEHKTKSCWHVLKLRGRRSYPKLLQQMKPWSIILVE
jgi:hypothetical protein